MNMFNFYKLLILLYISKYVFVCRVYTANNIKQFVKVKAMVKHYFEKWLVNKYDIVTFRLISRQRLREHIASATNKQVAIG